MREAGQDKGTKPGEDVVSVEDLLTPGEALEDKLHHTANPILRSGSRGGEGLLSWAGQLPFSPGQFSREGGAVYPWHRAWGWMHRQAK